MKKAWKVKVVRFFWRLRYKKIWHKGEPVIPRNTPFCCSIHSKGIYACPFLLSLTKHDCCMYAGESLERRLEKICDINK